MIVNWNGMGDILAKVIGTLLMIAFFVAGIILFVKSPFGTFSMGNTPGAMADALMRGILAITMFIIAAALFIAMYVRGIAERITNFMLWPKKMLAFTPPALSPIMAMLARREFDAAEKELLLFETEPDDTAVARMLIELYAEDLHRPDAAVDLAERYYGENRRRRNEDNYLFLLIACDQYLQLGRKPDAIELLRGELRRSCYSNAQKNGICKRISVLED